MGYMQDELDREAEGCGILALFFIVCFFIMLAVMGVLI